jgi:F-type H+-transporting ATPase subunit alpha
VVQTEAQDVSAYIPTNLISITDGQVLLSPRLFQEGVLPAVDVGRSVSRVGGKTQFPAYRDVAGDLRLAYSQFEELESFSRFASRLDEETRATLEHGRRVRAILEQRQYDPMPVLEQLALLLAVSEGLVDEEPVDAVGRIAEEIRARVRERHRAIGERIEAGEDLSEDDRDALLDAARSVIERDREHRAERDDGEERRGASEDRGDHVDREDRRGRGDHEERGGRRTAAGDAGDSGDAADDHGADDAGSGGG